MSKLKERFQESTDQAERAELLIALAGEAWSTGNYSEGKIFSEAALELGQRMDNPALQATACHLLGTIYSYLDSYDQALHYLMQAQRKNASLGLAQQEAEDYNSMGDIFIKLSNIPKATECFEKSHQLYPEYERSVNNLGYLKMLKGEYHEAIDFYRMAERIATEKRNYRSQIISKINIADSLSTLNQIEEARTELTVATRILDEVTIDTPLEISCALKLNLSQVSKPSTALSLLNEVRQICTEHGLKDYLQKALYMLAEQYARRKEWQKAYEHLLEYTSVHNQLINSSILQKASTIQSFYAKETRDLLSLNLTEKSAKLATLGILSTGITHELNQPLSAIRISAESILYWIKKESIVLPLNFNVELNHILEGIKRIEDFIRQIRQFWNSGRSGEINPVNPEEIMQKSLGLVSRRMFAQGIKLQQETDSELPFLEMSEIHLQQIMINLLNHHMGLLESSAVKHRILKLNLGCNDGFLTFSITQNGTSITQDMILRLYNPLSGEGNESSSEMDMAIVKYFCDHYKFKLQLVEENGFWGVCVSMGVSK